jgi:hypothetical protein
LTYAKYLLTVQRKRNASNTRGTEPRNCGIAREGADLIDIGALTRDDEELEREAREST